MSERHYNVSEVAKLLSVSKGTIKNMINRKDLRAIIVGEKCVRIPETALDEYLNKAKKR